MARFSGFCCLLLICSWYQVAMGNPFLVGVAVFEKAMLIYDAVEKIEELRKADVPSNADLYDKLKELSDDFQDLRREIMDKISHDLKDKLTEKTDLFFKHVGHIEYKYGLFVDYLKPNSNYNSTIHKFATESTSSDINEVGGLSWDLYKAFVGPDFKDDTLLSIIAKQRTAPELMCIKHQSKQQLINDLYKAFVDSSTKALMVTLFSYDVRSKFENQPLLDEKQGAKDKFQARINSSFTHYKNALKMSSREMWRCDPGQHKQNVTYDKLQELFQAFFVKKTDTADYEHGKMDLPRAMVSKCSEMTKARLRCESDECKAQPEERRCTGILRDCQALPSSFQVCHSPPGSDRRYDWLREKTDSKTTLYGLYDNNPKCAKTQDLENEFYNNLAGMCLCNCDSEDRTVDRYFSLQAVLSDVDNNKVVTGVQLVKDNHVFHIKIQQAILGPNGTVMDEPTWKNITSIPESKLLGKDVSTPHEKDDSKWVYYYKNELVYTMDYERKTIYLDTLNADPNRLVTGLRFQHVDDSLKLEIQTTGFNYETGELDKGDSSWKSNGNDMKARKELQLLEPDDPRLFYGSTKDSTHNQFINFTMTDLPKDFGQYTVPFIDVQQVVMNPPLPLSGVGIIHRGTKGSGGFLAFKVIHYDYVRHL